MKLLFDYDLKESPTNHTVRYVVVSVLKSSVRGGISLIGGGTATSLLFLKTLESNEKREESEKKQREINDIQEERITELEKSQSKYLSIADELSKLAKLKSDGIITDEEFTKMKQDLINKITKY